MESVRSSENIVHRPQVSLALAQQLLVQVKLSAEERGVEMGAVVVDVGGNVVASARMDGAQLGAMGLAADKAFTAVSFGYPTSRWTNSSGPGGPDWGLAATFGGRIVVIPGGVPVFHEGVLVGGLGVSGAAAAVDEACAKEALAVVGLETP
jgi:glc operon protein GlcG